MHKVMKSLTILLLVAPLILSACAKAKGDSMPTILISQASDGARCYIIMNQSNEPVGGNCVSAQVQMYKVTDGSGQ